MRERRVDVAVIGAGTAGMGAFRAAQRSTESVLLIEGAQYGTTCARVGCMPSKLLIAAAEAAHMVHKAPAFGVETTPPKINGRAVMQRVQRERDRFVGFVVETVEEWPADQRLMGEAQFLDDHIQRFAELSKDEELAGKALQYLFDGMEFAPDFDRLGKRKMTA